MTCNLAITCLTSLEAQGIVRLAYSVAGKAPQENISAMKSKSVDRAMCAISDKQHVFDLDIRSSKPSSKS